MAAEAPTASSPEADPARPVPWLAATMVAGGAFVLALALIRLEHPLLLARHVSRALEECSTTAVIAFFASLLISHFRRARES